MRCVDIGLLVPRWRRAVGLGGGKFLPRRPWEHVDNGIMPDLVTCNAKHVSTAITVTIVYVRFSIIVILHGTMQPKCITF